MDSSVTEAGKLYAESIEALREQRQQIEEDLAFSDPSNPQQWDEREKLQREQDPGGARPCLVMDQCGQYVANVAGQVEQRPPAIHAIPVDSGADRKVAETLDGFFRHIEHTSRAQQHYARALTSAARAGVGYLVVRPEYVDRAMGYQEPRISSEGDPLRVVFDPWSVELDGSDGNFGFLLTPFSHREFERQFGAKADKVSFGSEDRKIVRDDRESILVAEMWKAEDKSSNIIVYMTPEMDEASGTEDEYHIACQQAGAQLPVLKTYRDKYRCVKWSRMSGAAVLDKETEYPAKSIGIVPVYGYVGWSSGRMKYCGIPRRARDPQRAYNYHVSEIRALMGMAPKAPWLVPKRAVRGVESLWDRASVESRAWLPYNDLDEDGAIQQPQRMQVSTNLQNHIQNAEQAKQDIQAAIGMYQANLGAPSNETSGIAIESRKQQGEASTAHFPSHLAASLGQVGKLVMEMIPRLIDTKRQIRILGIDQTPGAAIINPDQPQAMQETPKGLSINPNVGRYDVRVVVGSSFSTQRQQAQQAYTEMMRSNPQMMPAIAPLWAQTLDVPHADKLAQVLTAMAPDPVKAILDPNPQESTAQLKAEIDHLKQALQEAVQHAQEATAEADQAEQELAKKARDEGDREEEAEARVAELHLKAYDSVTKRIQVVGSTNAAVLQAQTTMQAAANPDPLGGVEGPGPDGSVSHETAEGEQPEPQEMQPDPAVAELHKKVDDLTEGHTAMAEALLEVAKMVKAPRKRIPVRDKDGFITQVIDRIEDGTESGTESASAD